MLIIKQYEEKNIYNISEIRNGKTIFFHIGVSEVESRAVIRRFMSRYIKEVELRQEAMDLLM